MARKMKDSGVEWIGQIPEDWELCKLKNIIEFKNGYAFDSALMSNNGKYPVIRIGDIKEGSIDILNANKIDDNKGIENYLIKDKDILLAMSGATVGKLGYIHCIETECYINQRVGIIRAENSRYIYYYLSTDEFIKYVLLLSAGSAQPNISTENINNYYICFPDEEKQRKIVAFLDEKVGEIDTIIAKTKETIEEYKKYKQAVITEAVTKGLDKTVPMKNSGIEWIGKIPEHWKVKKLKYVCVNRKEKYSSEYGNLDYFGLENIISQSGEYIETSNKYDLEQSQLCMKNDVVFGKLRPYLAKVYLVDKNRCCSSEFAVFADFDGIASFYKYVFLSYGFIKMVDASTYGTKMPRANIDFINNMFIPVPEIKKQQEIAKYLDAKCAEIDTLIAKKEAFVSEMENYKKSLIYEYVTGKKEVI